MFFSCGHTSQNMEIYKRIPYTKTLVFHNEFADDMDYNMALGNISHTNDDYVANRNFEKQDHTDYKNTHNNSMLVRMSKNYWL